MTSCRTLSRLPLLAAGMLVFIATGAAQQIPVGAGAPTDAEAISMLLRSAAEDAAIAASSSCGSGPLFLRVLPEDAPPALTQVFAEELMQRGIAVRTAGEAESCRLTVEARALRSSTVSSGNSSYLRKIESTLGLTLEQRDGTVAYARERQLVRSDTLSGTPPYAERSYLHEERSWWESLIEPALVTVTAVVIVVLLFTVRGSS